MKTFFTLFFVLSLTGCASVQKRFAQVQIGDSEERVIEIMGDPEGTRTEGNFTKMAWSINSYSGCFLVLDGNRKVTNKECNVDYELKARQQAAAAQIMMRSYQYQAPTTYQAPVYQTPRQTQTNCQTRWVGNTAYSDCSSAPTGIDAGIYNR